MAWSFDFPGKPPQSGRSASARSMDIRSGRSVVGYRGDFDRGDTPPANRIRRPPYARRAKSVSPVSPSGLFLGSAVEGMHHALLEDNCTAVTGTQSTDGTLGRDDLQEVDLEYQCRSPWNGRGPTLILVRNRGRTDQLCLAADLHLLNSLRPAGDYLIEPKFHWLATLDGAVELGATGQGAPIVHLDGVGGFGRRSCSLLQVLVDHSG